MQPAPGWAFGRPRDSSGAYHLRRPIWRIARSCRARYRVVTAWVCDTEVEVLLASDIGRCLWVAGCYEPNELYVLSRLLSSNDTFIDIGANVGLYSIAAARLVGDHGKVVSFEPSPRERLLLVRNIARNGLSQVIVEPRAVGDKVDEHAVLQLADEAHGGQNTFGEFIYRGVRLADRVVVETITLDQVVADMKLARVSAVKMDVEGAEVAVLTGAHEVLRRDQPVILAELQESSLVTQGSSAGEMLGALAALDYGVYGYARRSGVPLLHPLSSDESLVSQNIVAISLEKRDQFEDLFSVVA